MKKIIFSTESIAILIIINILTISAALKLDFIQSLEMKSYDFSMNKNRQITNTNNRITTITIDKQSTEMLGPWPWDRSVIAEMLNKLTTAEAKVIGLQFLLAGKRNNQKLNEFDKLKDYVTNNKKLRKSQSRKLKKLLRKTERELDTDGQLAKSISKAPNLILSMEPQASHTYSNQDIARPPFINKIRIKGKKPKKAKTSVYTVNTMFFPLDIFANNAQGIGHNLTYDEDDTIRSHPLILRYNKNYFPSFSLLLAAHSQEISPSSLRITKSGVKLGRRKIKTNSKTQFYPVFRPQNNKKISFQQYSFVKVLNGDVPLKNFKDKTVIIGLADQYATATDKMSAPLISANIITSLIDENYINKPNWAKPVELFIFIGILVYLFLAIPNLNTTITSLVSLFLVTVLIGVNQYFLIIEHIWLQTITATFVLLFGHILYMIYHRLSASKRKFLADSAESIRMLVTALQSQGQIDMAMDKLRSIPKIDTSVLELAYGIAQDYESKRQLGKAISVYDFILENDKKFRDAEKRKERAESVESAVLVHSNSSIMNVIDTMPKLGHYEVEKELGRGAMGVVYLARDTKINRTVAIKTLTFSEEFEGQDLKDVTKRFFREAEVAGKLNHPNIVTVHDAGQEHDLTYMAMEFLDGHDLTHYINDKKKPKVDWVLDIIWHVAGALDYAHEAGIVHRDIKPANIMYTKDGTVKITDFGIARVTDSSTTKTGTALGTPSYMSPEQISGEKVKGSSDFFSLGVTMYELLTGELPFQGDSLPAMIYQITTKRHPSITQVRKRLPACVKTIVDKLLQKDPRKRYPDGASIQEAIERCMKK